MPYRTFVVILLLSYVVRIYLVFCYFLNRKINEMFSASSCTDINHPGKAFDLLHCENEIIKKKLKGVISIFYAEWKSSPCTRPQVSLMRRRFPAEWWDGHRPCGHRVRVQRLPAEGPEPRALPQRPHRAGPGQDGDLRGGGPAPPPHLAGLRSRGVSWWVCGWGGGAEYKPTKSVLGGVTVDSGKDSRGGGDISRERCRYSIILKDTYHIMHRWKHLTWLIAWLFCDYRRLITLCAKFHIKEKNQLSSYKTKLTFKSTFSFLSITLIHVFLLLCTEPVAETQK